jgi:hypothetical protein
VLEPRLLLRSFAISENVVPTPNPLVAVKKFLCLGPLGQVLIVGYFSFFFFSRVPVYTFYIGTILQHPPFFKSTLIPPLSNIQILYL